MKILLLAAAVASSSFVGRTSAAPAIVWKKNVSSSTTTSHISNSMDARSLLSSIGGSNTNNNNNNNAALSAVIFLVGRDADGSEGLSSLMMMDNNNSMLSGVQARYLEANEIYYHVTGVESARTMARDARESMRMMVGEDTNKEVTTTVAEVTIEEFQRKLASMAQSEVEEEEETSSSLSSSSPETKMISKAQQKRRKAISEADVLVVSVTAGGANKSLDSDSIAKLDAAIVAAIDSSAIQNVVLSSIRSTHEVKHARKLAVVERLTKKWSSTSSSSRRRLEDAAAAEDNADNNQAADMSGIYYVNMTPNIFAGLLFFLLFVMTAYIGLTCMNMIEGQDVYVKKMPHIGREV